MDVEYIIVQAGGKGSRLGYLTKNKPKAIVPIENLPMLFHLFSRFPDKKYIIIADYKKEVLREYLRCFAKVIYQVADACGTGTSAGIKQAVSMIPEGKAFMIIWSDLILTSDFQLPYEEGDYIGISETFPCRWSYRDGNLEEVRSVQDGVAGLFIIQDKARLREVPESGELVRWMKESDFNFKGKIGLAGTKEFGILSEYEKLTKEKCRPFNKITAEGNILIKEGIGEQGKKLAVPEREWYEKSKEYGITKIPRIYSFEPLKMERIQGKNIYEYNLSYQTKKKILEQLVAALKEIHGKAAMPADSFSLKEAYYNKTWKRLSKVRDLIPFADQKTIRINGRNVRNVFFYKRELEKKLEILQGKCSNFCFIHGDCTFSNMMLKEDGESVLIDPRGYFGFTRFYGDPLYDWAKLYYSLKGNYDRFNLKDFRLDLEDEVKLTIASNHWEDMEEDFFAMTGSVKEDIMLLHGVIWLSLTTYAWQDYDSVCGAFYNGLYYLEEIL